MKIATIVVRVLLGLLFLAASVPMLLGMVQMPELQGAQKAFMEGMGATRYFFPLLKGTELICGLAFVIGRFVPLALVIISPIVINIFLYHAFVAPEQGMGASVFLILATAFLGYAYRENFKGILAAK